MPRPPRADAAAVNVVVRFSPDELAAVRRLAGKASVSAFLRLLVAEEDRRRARRKARSKP